MVTLQDCFSHFEIDNKKFLFLEKYVNCFTYDTHTLLKNERWHIKNNFT